MGSLLWKRLRGTRVPFQAGSHFAPYLRSCRGCDALYAASVLLLTTIAAICCILLAGVAAALWWSMQREPQPEERPRRFADAMQGARRRAHPRMDLAAGLAAGSPKGSQHVSSALRAHGPAPNAEVPAAFGERLAVIPRKHRRIDLAGSNDNPSDFSDPGLRLVSRSVERRTPPAPFRQA